MLSYVALFCALAQSQQHGNAVHALHNSAPVYRPKPKKIMIELADRSYASKAKQSNAVAEGSFTPDDHEGIQ
jgi:hypothetical protein